MYMHWYVHNLPLQDCYEKKKTVFQGFQNKPATWLYITSYIDQKQSVCDKQTNLSQQATLPVADAYFKTFWKSLVFQLI